jgi:hypothetical protein
MIQVKHQSICKHTCTTLYPAQYLQPVSTYPLFPTHHCRTGRTATTGTAVRGLQRSPGLDKVAKRSVLLGYCIVQTAWHRRWRHYDLPKPLHLFTNRHTVNIPERLMCPISQTIIFTWQAIHFVRLEVLLYANKQTNKQTNKHTHTHRLPCVTQHSRYFHSTKYQ